MMTSWLLTLALVCGQTTESSQSNSKTTDRSAAPAESAAEKSSSAKAGDTKPSDTKPAELKATVLRLVKQLDDSQLVKREAAEKELIALGADALTLLPAVTKQTPAEVKDRLARIRRALESAAA